MSVNTFWKIGEINLSFVISICTAGLRPAPKGGSLIPVAPLLEL